MSEWKQVYLTEAFDIASGLSKPASEFGSGFPFLSFKEIFNNFFIPEELPELVESSPQEREKCSVQKGDVFLTRTSETVKELGMSSVALKDYENATFNGFTKRLRPNGKFDIIPEYAGYYFRSSKFRHEVTAMSSASTRASLNNEMLGRLTISLPSKEEQEAIASALFCLDRKIENLRRQNETLEAIAQTLFKHWFVDFEFPNADGKPYKSSGGAMEPSELGEIPAGWRVGKLGDVVKVNAESISKSYQHKKIEYVDISSVGIGVLEGTTSYLFKSAPSRARRLVKHGDVIWSGVRPNRKSYLFISHPPKNLVVSTGFITLTPDSIPSSYLYSWVTTESFVEYLTFNASGSAYPAVKAEHFEIADILLPDKFNLTKFHAVIEPMREKIHQNYRQIQTLTKTRDVLLPKLMSGKLRIKP